MQTFFSALLMKSVSGLFPALLMAILLWSPVSEAQCGRCGTCGVSKARPVLPPPPPPVREIKPTPNPFSVKTEQPRPAVVRPGTTAVIVEDTASQGSDSGRPASVTADQTTAADTADNGAADRRRQSRARADARLGRSDVQMMDGMETLPVEINHAAHRKLIGSLASLLGFAGLNAEQNNEGLCSDGFDQLCKVAANDAAKRLKKALEDARKRARAAAEEARREAQRKIDEANKEKQKKLDAKKKAAEDKQKKHKKRMKKDKRYRDRKNREDKLKKDRERLDKKGKRLEKEGKRLDAERKGLEEEEKRLRKAEGDARKGDPNCRSSACQDARKARQANSRAITENARQTGKFQSEQSRFQGEVQNHARHADRLERLKDGGYGMNKDEYRSHLSDKRNAKAHRDLHKSGMNVADAKQRADEARKKFGRKSPQYKKAQAELRHQEKAFSQAQKYASKTQAHAVKSRAYMYGLKDEYKAYENAQDAFAKHNAAKTQPKSYKKRTANQKALGQHAANHQDFIDKLGEAQYLEGLSDAQLQERIDILDTADQRLQQAMDNNGKVPPLSGKAFDQFNQEKAHKAKLEKQLADLDQRFEDSFKRGPVFADAAKGHQRARQKILNEIAETEQGLTRFDPMFEMEDYIDVLDASAKRMQQAVDSVGGKVPPPSGKAYDRLNNEKKARKDALKKKLAELDRGMEKAFALGPVMSDAAKGYQQARQQIIRDIAEVDKQVEGYEPLKIAEKVADTTRAVNKQLASLRQDVPYKANGEIDTDKLTRRVVMVGRSQMELAKLSGEMTALQKNASAGTLGSRESRRLKQLGTTIQNMTDELKQSGIDVTLGKDGRIGVKTKTLAGAVTWNAASDSVRENILEVNKTRERIAKIRKQGKANDLLPTPNKAKDGIASRVTGKTAARPQTKFIPPSDAALQAMMVSNPIMAGVYRMQQQAARLAASRSSGTITNGRVAKKPEPRPISKKPVKTLLEERRLAKEKAETLRRDARTKIDEAKKAKDVAEEAIERAQRSRESNTRFATTNVRRAETYKDLAKAQITEANDYRAKGAALRDRAANLEKSAQGLDRVAGKKETNKILASNARTGAAANREDAEKLLQEAAKVDARAAQRENRAQEHAQTREGYIEDARKELAEAKQAEDFAREKIEEAQKKAGVAQTAAAKANEAIRGEFEAGSDLAKKQKAEFNKLIGKLPSGNYFSSMEPETRTQWLKDNVPNWDRMNVDQKGRVLDTMRFSESRVQAREAGEALDKFIADKWLTPNGLKARTYEITLMEEKLKKMQGDWTLSNKEERDVRILKNKIKRAKVQIATDLKTFGEMRENVESKVHKLKVQQWALDETSRQEEINRRVDTYARAKGELKLARLASVERDKAFINRLSSERKKLRAAKTGGKPSEVEKAQTAIDRLEASQKAWREQDTSNINSLKKLVDNKRNEIVSNSISDNLGEISTDKRLDEVADIRLIQATALTTVNSALFGDALPDDSGLGSVMVQRMDQMKTNVNAVVNAVDTSVEKFDPWGAVITAYDKTKVGLSVGVGGTYGLMKGGVKGIAGLGKLIIVEPIDAVGEDLEAIMALTTGYRTNIFGNDNMEFVEGVIDDPGKTASAMFFGLGKQLYDTTVAAGHVVDAFESDSAQLAFDASSKVGETVGEFVLDPSLLAGGWGKLATVLRAGGKGAKVLSAADKLADGLKFVNQLPAKYTGGSLKGIGAKARSMAESAGLGTLIREAEFSLHTAGLLDEVPGFIPASGRLNAAAAADAFADAARLIDGPLNEALAAIPNAPNLPKAPLSAGKAGPISPRAGPDGLPTFDVSPAPPRLPGVEPANARLANLGGELTPPSTPTLLDSGRAAGQAGYIPSVKGPIGGSYGSYRLPRGQIPNSPHPVAGALDQGVHRVGAQPPARGIDPRRVDVSYNPAANGKVVLKRSDGTELHLNNGNLLGEGSFSRAYDVPGSGNPVAGNRGQAVKLTTAGDGVMDDLGRGAIESIGKPGVIKTPRVHAQYPIGEAPLMPHSRYSPHASGLDRAKDFRGGTVSVVDQAPPVFNSKEAAGVIRAADGKMTPGQAIAFNRGMKELNSKGFAWLDNKGDNFSFERIGGAGSDEWALVVVDPGGIIPVKAGKGKTAAQNARDLQKAVDAPPQQLVDDYLTGLGDLGRNKHQNALASQFDEVVDWDGVRVTTGQDYGTLAYPREGAAKSTLPYFPGNAAKYPKLRQVAGAADEVLEKAERVLRASSPTPPDLPGDLAAAKQAALNEALLPGSSAPTLPQPYPQSASTLLDPVPLNQLDGKAALNAALPEASASTLLDGAPSIPRTWLDEPIPPTLGSRAGRLPDQPIPPTIGSRAGRLPDQPIPPTIGSRAGRLPDQPIPPTIGSRAGLLPGQPIPPTIGSRAGRLPDQPIPPTRSPVDRLATTAPESLPAPAYPRALEGSPAMGRTGVQGQVACENCALVAGEAILLDMNLIPVERSQKVMRAYAVEKEILKPQLADTPGGVNVNGVRDYMRANGVAEELMDIQRLGGREIGEAANAGKEVMAIIRTEKGSFHWVRIEGMKPDASGKLWLSYGEGGRVKGVSKRMPVDDFERINRMAEGHPAAGEQLGSLVIDRPGMTEAHLAAGKAEAMARTLDGAEALAKQDALANAARAADSVPDTARFPDFDQSVPRAAGKDASLPHRTQRVSPTDTPPPVHNLDGPRPDPKMAPATQADIQVLNSHQFRVWEGQQARDFQIGTERGKGAHSTVYDDAADTRSMIKVTRRASPEAVILDRRGYEFTNQLPPEVQRHAVRTPRIHEQINVARTNHPDLQGATFTRVEKAPPTFRDQMGKGLMNKRRMQPGEAVNFHTAQRAFNQEGFVWLDNKYDNYGFEDIPGGEGQRVVVHDPGGIVPIKAPSAEARRAIARRFQKSVSSPPPDLLDRFQGVESRVIQLEQAELSILNMPDGALKQSAQKAVKNRLDTANAELAGIVHEHMGQVMKEFGHYIDLDRLGLKSTGDIAFNTINGFMFERQRILINADHSPQTMARALFEINQ